MTRSQLMWFVGLWLLGVVLTIGLAFVSKKIIFGVIKFAMRDF